jgi:two-component system, chemotaxis family, CheB/CheR fusion protein
MASLESIIKPAPANLKLDFSCCSFLTEKIFHARYADRPQGIRIWVTGCSSGEESYTVALSWYIFLQNATFKSPVRIFCSDLDDSHIVAARHGFISAESLKPLEAKYVKAFFTREGTKYQVKKQIRDSCVFAPHNLHEHPPFRNVDLIICCNEAAAIEVPALNNIFKRLYYSLNSTGNIFFQSSLSLLAPKNLFKQHEDLAGLFSKNEECNMKRGDHSSWTDSPNPFAKGKSHNQYSQLEREAEKELLKNSPPALVINQEMEIVRFYGDTSGFIQPSTGKATLQLTKLIRPEISIPALRLILESEKKTGILIEEDILVDGETHSIEVRTLQAEDTKYFILIIHHRPEKIFTNGVHKKKNLSSERVSLLEKKLLESQVDIQALKEAYEATNEELQSAYEEIVSSNEELHSINEELEDSKKSLERSNNELLEVQNSLLSTQKQLNSALQAGETGVWTWTVDTGVVSWSEQHEKLYGLNPGGFEGTLKHWLKLIHPDDFRKIKYELDRGAELFIPFDQEFRIIFPDNSIHWILCKAETFYIGQTQQKQVAGISMDVTEKNLHFAKLLESEDRFHFVCDNAPVMIWMVDQDQKFTFVNKMWSFFNGDSTELSIEDWLTKIHPADQKETLKAFNEATRKQKEFKLEYRFRRFDGQFRWILNQAVPRFEGKNVFRGFIGTCIDITERVESLHQKDEFIGIASHELKTPVTSIKSYAEIIHMKMVEAGDESLSGLFKRMNLQIDKLAQLINKLLDATRIESGQLELFKEEFDLNRFVLDVCEDVQTAGAKNRLIKDLSAKGVVYADRDRIGQVLSNLILNAVKYSPDDSEITIETKELDNEFVVSVKDSGAGIPPQDRENIFKRFYRGKDENLNRIAGLGLGLYISSEIIRKHEGKIRAESNSGHGSVFLFSLPKKQANGR